VNHEWLTGDFVGEYVGELDPAAEQGRAQPTRSFRLEIVRATVTNPRACSAPSADAVPAPIYQTSLEACYFALGEHAELRQCPLREIVVHDWRRIEAGESGSRLYGRIRGVLYARMVEEPAYVAIDADPEPKNVASIHIPSVEPELSFAPAPLPSPRIEPDGWDADKGGWMTLLGLLTFLCAVVLLLPLWVAAGVMLNALIPFLVLLSLLTWILGGKKARAWAWFMLVTTVMITAVYAVNEC
jgi:hypothetical protein